MINLVVKPFVFVIIITLPVWIYIRIGTNLFKKDNKNISSSSAILYNLFYLYIAAVLAVTVVPVPLTSYKLNGYRGVNLLPVINTLNDFIDALTQSQRYLLRPVLENIIGNIILFMPLGCFLPILFSRINSLKKVVTVALLSSLSIELIQLILRQFHIYRNADIDDIILNVSGAIAGYFVYRLMKSVEKKSAR